MGFDDVFEVSAAAELVSEATRQYISEHEEQLPLISTACPSVVRLIRVRFPNLIPHLLQMCIRARVNTPLHISGVEQVVSLLASGLSQISGVELLDSRILMGLTDWVGCIYIIEHLCAQAADIRGIAYVSGLLGLSAAVYTAAGASHDFDEVIVGFSGFNLI